MNRSVKTIVLGILLAASPSQVWACPMCKYALESSSVEPKAYMISILFMMGMITALFAAVAGLLWYVSKLEKMNLTAAGYQHLFENAVSHSRATEDKMSLDSASGAKPV